MTLHKDQKGDGLELTMGGVRFRPSWSLIAQAVGTLLSLAVLYGGTTVQINDFRKEVEKHEVRIAAAEKTQNEILVSLGRIESRLSFGCSGNGR